MKCPRCQQAMKDIRGVAVCRACGGAFVACAAVDTVTRAFDAHAQSMAELAAQHAPRNARVDTASHARCPQCDAPMTRFRVGPVEVDTCFAHGSWYDRGELAQVRDALQAGAATTQVSASNSLADDAFGPAPDARAAPAAPAAPAARAPLELAHPPKRSPPPSARPMGGGIDPGAQQAIANLQKHEKAERDRKRRAERHLRRHSRDGVDDVFDAVDLVGDIIDILS